MNTIENEILSVRIKSKGAELDSIYHKTNKLEYLWSGDPAFWAKKSPVLFPIVGTLKDGKYFIEGRPYELGRHGFAREREFKVLENSGTAIRFSLESDEETLKLFPFLFSFEIRYSLQQNDLWVSYVIKNKSEAEMYFSVGGHPAFKVPLVESTSYEDYFLEFNHPEQVGRWPVSRDGLIETTPVPLLNNSNRLPLTKDLFRNDALVLKDLSSDKVVLKSDKTPHGFEFVFTGFPYLGIWAFPGADFVCIEPWCGIADSINSNQQLTEKEGINKLASGKVFERTWQVKLF